MADIDNFLKAISLTESLGGKYTDHKPITYGPLKGEQAIGKYGLMPSTIQEVAGMSADPDVQALKNIDKSQLRSVLEATPDLQDKVAKELATPILNRQGGDPAKASYAWRWGHNLPPQEIEKKGYMDKEHVQRFLRNLDKVSPSGVPAALSPDMPPMIPPALDPNANPIDMMVSDALKGKGIPRETYPSSPLDPIGQAQDIVDPTGTMRASPTGFVTPISNTPDTLPTPASVDMSLVQPPVEQLQTLPEQPLMPAPISIPQESTGAPLALPEDSPMDALQAAQKERDRLAGLLTIARAGERMGAAIAGTKSDPGYLSELSKLVDAPVSDVITGEKLKAGVLEREKLQRSVDLDKLKDDPTSDLSKMYRDSAKALISRTESLKGLNVPDSLSAGAMEKYSPMLFNIISQDLARQAKLEASQAAKAAKEETRQEKREQQRFENENKIQTKIKTADKDTAFSQTKYSYEGLKRKLETGQWDSLQDIAAIYSFIKALDPGSVVRESETELVLSAQSPLAKYGNTFRRVSQGDLASPTYRTKLLKAFESLYQDRKLQFEHQIRPLENQAKEYGLNLNNIIDREIPDYNSDKVMVVNPDGVTGRIPKSQLDQALKQGYKVKE